MVTSEPSLETNLLLCCARTSMDLETSEQIRNLLKKGLDWDFLFHRARLNKLLPFLYWHLKTICSEAVPKAFWEQIQTYFNDNARQMDILTKELVKLLNLFKEHNIPAIPYKGPVLADLIYNNLALRRCADLDILVHKTDILKAKELLISENYNPYLTLEATGYKPTFQFTSVQEAEWLNNPLQFNYKFKPSDDKLKPLEIHWSISAQGSCLKLDSEWYWNSVKPRSFAGTTVLSFLPEDLLLVLCVNSMKDQWRFLRGICDVAELLRVHPEMDWTLVMKQARSLRIERILFLGLLLSWDLLEAKLPIEIIQRIQADPLVKLYAYKVRQYLFSEKDSIPVYFSYYLFNLMRDPPVEKVPYRGYLLWQFIRLGITPTEKDRRILPLPVFFEFLYYLIRPVRLAGKGVLKLFQKLKSMLEKRTSS